MLRLLLLLLTLPPVIHAGGLTFARPSQELVAKLGATSITADFAFTNNTGKPVTILRHESACSCMTIEPVGKKVHYAPGESGVLRATFEKGRYTGTVEKTVKLWLAGDPADKPSSLLRLSVRIPVQVELSEKTVNWKIGSPGTERVVRITIHGGKPVKITSVTCSDPNFHHALRTIEEGKSYELKVSCTSTANRAMGVYRIETDSADEGQRVVQVFGVVKP